MLRAHTCVPRVIILAALCGAAIGCSKTGKKITIFHADSLNVPISALAEVFEADHPGVDVIHESGGSLHMTREVSELGRHCDILAVADYRLLDQLMIPEHADWQLLFARNEMVIAYTGMSRGGDEITPENWPSVLLRPDTIYSHSDPNQDPSGYRTLLCWKLADAHYKEYHGTLYELLNSGCDPKYIRPDANQILNLLEAIGGVDYLFTYRSVAEQHHLQYVKLPDPVNLGNPRLEHIYKQARVEVRDRKGNVTVHTGAPIAYGLTIPKSSRSPKAALAFVKFVLSQQGQAILRKNHQPLIQPPLYKGSNIPPELLSLAEPLDQQ